MRAFALGLIIILLSCSDKKKSEGVNVDYDTTKTYSFSNDSTYIRFTAYKFTQKIGVNGSFDTVMVKNVSNDASNPFQVFKNASFEISTESLNTADKDRDAKIKAHFFANLKDGNMLNGKVLAIDDNGAGTFEVTINGIAKIVPFKSTYMNNNVELNAEIDLEEFMAQDAIKSLNEICKVLHTGPDGLVKLWPNISLYFKVNVK